VVHWAQRHWRRVEGRDGLMVADKSLRPQLSLSLRLQLRIDATAGSR